MLEDFLQLFTDAGEPVPALSHLCASTLAIPLGLVALGLIMWALEP